MMGYSKEFQDMKCNIHVSGRGGVAKFIETFGKLSEEARNVITVENDEFSTDLETCLLLKELCPIVFDIHHHWIHNKELMKVDDSRIMEVLESWRGLRPAMHYSQPREEFFNIEKDKNSFLDINKLLLNGFNKRKLSAHSDMMWNNKFNENIKDFEGFFDIMIEAKNKNRASIDLIGYLKKIRDRY